MTREESWKVKGITLALLRQITALGYVVSVFRFPESMLSASEATVEMHAIDLRPDPLQKHVARILINDAADPDYSCACLLAEMVGIDLADG